MEKKLALCFPGMGYTCDRPLLRVCAEAYAGKGYEIRKLDYGGIDFYAIGTVEEALDAVKARVLAQAEGIEFSAYADVVFVSKSFGTLVAPWLDDEKGVGARHLFLTPPAEALPQMDGKRRVFAAAVGTLDPHVDFRALVSLCKKRGIPCAVFEGVGHSLECEGDARRNGEILRAVGGLCT